MKTEVTYEAKPVAAIEAELLRDLNNSGKEWAIVRTSAISEKVWGFYATRALAVAACRRWRAREIVTR